MPDSGRSVARGSLRAGLLVAVTGGIAVVSGLPFVFPSLGPTAYVLALEGDASAREVVGAHVVGVVIGGLAYAGLASGLVVTGSVAPLSVAGVRLAVAASVSVVGTTAGMLVLDVRHAPACATTLIVSLGLLSGVVELGVMVVSVVVLCGANRGLMYAMGESGGDW